MRTVWITIGALLAGGLAWRAAWWHTASRQTGTPSYTDARKCQACHPVIYREYRHVGMARSFSSVSGVPLEEYDGKRTFIHALSGRHYEALQRGSLFFQRRYELDSHGRPVNEFELEVTHVIGSGNHARTYLHRTELGEMIQLPLTWYSEGSGWGMSPGYDNPSPPDFTRLADESCQFCHNGYPEAGGILAQGIDCQRCHGPGSRHLELASRGNAAKSSIRAAIVNPARLSKELQMDICMQCHLETTSAELPQMIRRFDREPFSFRPGEPLGAYLVHFDYGSGTGHAERFEIVNQAYRLRQSACFRNSQGRLTCTSCHDPHAVPRGEAADRYYRARCVACHKSVAVDRHPDPAAADCRPCHMPRRRAEDAVHVVMTDHLIRRKPPSRDLTRALAEHSTSYRGPLAVYYPANLPQREHDLYLGAALITGGADRPHGIALLERAIQPDVPGKALAVLGEGYLAEGDANRAIRMFQRALEKNPGLAKARYNLAQAFESAGRPQEARTEYEQAIRTKPPFPDAEYALANLLAKSGDALAASQHYRNAIRARPVFAEAYNNLGNVNADQGRLDQALAALQQALRINPALAEAHNNLARILARRQRIPEALEHARRAVALRPGYSEGHYNLAQLLQASGSLPAAIAEYRRALAIRPDFAEAHLSLGNALGDAGRLDAAIAEFGEVLRLRPGHPAARRNLDAAMAMKRDGAR